MTLTTSGQSAQVYTDFAALAKLKNEAKNKTSESITEVAKQFESIFVGMVLKSMRQAKLADGIMDSSQSDFYRNMYDEQLSVHLSGKGGVGLADLIAKQLSPDQPNYARKNQQIGDYERKSTINVTNNKQGILNQDLQADAIAQNFIVQLRPYANQAAKKLGVDANLLLSQAALETGWGKSVIKNSHNLFNIKADRSWHGLQEKVSTVEFKGGVAIKEVADFRSYSSYQESFDDYVDFIKSNPRYKEALTRVSQPKQYIQALQKVGYATDHNYAKKVMAIYQGKHFAGSTSNLVATKQDIARGL